VVRYFQDEVSLDPLKLSAVGFGEYRPVDTNETPEGKQRNRRIEIKLVPLEAPLFGLAPKGTPEAPAPEASKP
jgi:chemotaxis protein MotB